MVDHVKADFIASIYCDVRKSCRETGMSWELILAQVGLEAGWGQKCLKGSKNLFNIKADAGWHGAKKKYYVPEEVNHKTVWVWDWFRIYESFEESFTDRTNFLKSNKRYREHGLFNNGVHGNFEKEAQALKDAGYATDSKYVKKLREVFDGPTMQAGIKKAEKKGCNCSSVLVSAIDSLKSPYVGAKITISYQPTTGSKVTKNFTADESGRIPAFDAPAGSILSFTINGKAVDKTITLETGKIKPLTLIDPTAQPIKAKTEVHDGPPKVKAKPKVDKPTEHKANSGKVITFDIELIDGDSKAVLPKTNYFLEYKGHQKAHQTDGTGMDKSINADAGETINVYVDGYNGQHQKVAFFTVKEGVGKMVVKIPSHRFDIFLRDEAAPLANFSFETHYRGKVKDRATNAAGKVTVTALVGQKIRLKTKDGEKIISFVVDATKQVYSCLVSDVSKVPVLPEKPKIVPEQSKDEEPKAVKEEPKAPKPAAKDISPKQIVVDERSEKGNPVLTVKITGENGNKTKKMIEILNENVGFGSKASPISGPTAVLASIKGKNISSHTKAAGKSLGQCYKYVKVGLQASGLVNVYLASQAAKDAGNDLKKAGFTNVLSSAMKSPYDAPVGGVIVYGVTDGSDWGHIEVFDGKYFYSDYKSPNSRVMRVGESPTLVGRKRKVIGIWVKS